MGNETDIEIRENLKYIYSVVNDIINSYEGSKDSLADKQKDDILADIMLRLGEISSMTQIDIHRLDMIFSVENINRETNGRHL